MSSFKRYLPCTDGQELKIQVYYHLGGMNYFTGKSEGRGYYLSVTPVKRERGPVFSSESFVGFSGIKKLLLPVSRQSEKKFQEAVSMVDANQQELIDYVCKKQGLTLATPEPVEAQ